METEMNQPGQLRLALQVQELVTQMAKQSQQHGSVEANMEEQWCKLSGVVKSLEEKYGVKAPVLTSKVRKLRPNVMELDVDSIMAIRRYVKAGYTTQQISSLMCLSERVVKKYSKSIFV